LGSVETRLTFSNTEMSLSVRLELPVASGTHELLFLDALRLSRVLRRERY